ncbi:MAG: xanthine dehydrogenase accessory protein XdhC [Woeseiaceae bacterium]|nr:xanthine dehydrogenase accessory protein XdhC [Woeseiaceae bacterium]
MNEWIEELSDLAAAGERVVLVTVAGIRGSAPREPGAKMIVTQRETVGTIGGGQLEYQCTRLAVGMLGESEGATLQSFPLGSAMGQCCGGVVDVLFEPLAGGLPGWLSELRALHGQRIPAVLETAIGDGHKSLAGGDAARATLDGRKQAFIEGDVLYEPVLASDMNIAVFGAGHVGGAVVSALSALDCNIRWVDSRRGIFRNVPKNVRPIETEFPALEVAALPPASSFLVMTHSHALDFEICDRILRRDDALYCGLIGSRSKRRRFEKRFRQQGMRERSLKQLVCPIGVAGIGGKKPAEIAVAVAADVLQRYERHAAAPDADYPDNVRPFKN